ncbi:MAG: hypothetical protein IID36_03925 [Planctomycetes bacterium]|nr:hypothetical protein [Planctomycetota bacterium]
MIVYRFDKTTTCSLLRHATTAGGNIFVGSDGADDGAFLRVRYRREPSDPAAVTITLALPFRGVGGAPEQIVFDVLGDGSGCRILLDAMDANAHALEYVFGPVDFVRWRLISAPIARPDPGSRSGSDEATTTVRPPLQFQQFAVSLDAGCAMIDVGFRSIAVTGAAFLTPTGLA